MLSTRAQGRTLLVIALALLVSTTALAGFAISQGGGGIPPHRHKGKKCLPPPKVETNVDNSHGG